jgi:hypothetical protein
MTIQGTAPTRKIAAAAAATDDDDGDDNAQHALSSCLTVPDCNPWNTALLLPTASASAESRDQMN